MARYVDIPLQHIHENMLERMRRETSRQYIVDLLGRIRAGIPGIALRTTFIVGFPGRDGGVFSVPARVHPRDEVRAAGRVHLFAGRGHARRDDGRPDSRPGETEAPRARHGRAARGGPADCPNRLSGARSKCSWKAAPAMPSSVRPGCSPREHGWLRESAIQNSKFKIQNYLVARGEADAPDIDGRVYVRGKLPPGEFARVKIIGHTDYDLFAVSGE